MKLYASHHSSSLKKKPRYSSLSKVRTRSVHGLRPSHRTDAAPHRRRSCQPYGGDLDAPHHGTADADVGGPKLQKSDELMSLELLLLDNKGFAVTTSIHYRRIPYYIGSLREGEIYELSNFEVVPAYERYMVTTARHSLRFTDGTQLNQLKDAAGDAHQIRNELFYTLTYEEYLALANTCSKLPDVVGQILSIQGPNLGDATSNQKIIILLRLAE